MGKIIPDPVERYLSGLNRLSDDVLRDIAADGSRRELPLVDAEVGALLRIQATAIGATRILEVGTAIGYSGIWLARALQPGGMLITIERDPERASEAKANFLRAGVSDRVSVMVGDASRTIAKLSGPFDLIFQDADKQQYGALLDPLLALLRPRGVLMTDNVLWSGEVVPDFITTPHKRAEDTQAVAAFNRSLASRTDVLTTWVPLRDGVAISVKQ